MTFCAEVFLYCAERISCLDYVTQNHAHSRVFILPNCLRSKSAIVPLEPVLPDHGQRLLFVPSGCCPRAGGRASLGTTTATARGEAASTRHAWRRTEWLLKLVIIDKNFLDFLKFAFITLLIAVFVQVPHAVDHGQQEQQQGEERWDNHKITIECVYLELLSLFTQPLSTCPFPNHAILQLS